MSIYRSQKMQPRNGHTLAVLNPNRISGCASQQDVSLDDQQEHAREVVREIFDGDNVDYRVIATKGKGELITRPELREIENALRSREIDVMIVEDLGRLVRGTEANRLCGIAVDHGTRVIAVNDGIDTWEEGWEEDVIAACRDHVGHNVHTSKRIKKKMMIRFKRNGAATPCQIAGYVKPVDAKTFHDWFVDESSRAIVADGAKLLREHLNCSLVADYFNTVKFPVGPYCRNEEWDGAMVRRYFGNPILKGKPERGNMHSVKHHETGKRRSQKNPEGPVSIDMPHLQIIPELEFDELNALLDEKNSDRGRKPYANGQDPLLGIPRKRTRFPGQHARCWYCGRIFVWGGNGIQENLQCTGSRSWNCWNSIGLNGPLFCQHVVNSITSMLNELEGIDSQYREIISSVAQSPVANYELERQQIASDEKALYRERQNYLDAIGMVGPNADIVERLQELKVKLNSLAVRKAALERKSGCQSDVPKSAGELAQMLKEEFLSLATNSYEFGALLPKIVPEVFVYCVRLCDGGPLLPRAKFTVDLSGSFESDPPDMLHGMLNREFTADGFEPPKRERIRQQVVNLSQQGLNLKQIAASFHEPISERVINQSIRLDKLMKLEQISDPYQLQLEPPSDLKKLRRHLNPRYKFSMLKGYRRLDI